jgi:hypothetical protein
MFLMKHILDKELQHTHVKVTDTCTKLSHGACGD